MPGGTTAAENSTAGMAREYERALRLLVRRRGELAPRLSPLDRRVRVLEEEIGEMEEVLFRLKRDRPAKRRGGTGG